MILRRARFRDVVDRQLDLFVRDHFARTLAEADAEEYEAEFNRAVGKRLRTFALEIENR